LLERASATRGHWLSFALDEDKSVVRGGEPSSEHRVDTPEACGHVSTMSAASLLIARGPELPWGRAAFVLALVLAAHVVALSLMQRTVVTAPPSPQITVLDAALITPLPPPPPAPVVQDRPPAPRVLRPRPKPAAPPPPPPPPPAPVEAPLPPPVTETTAESVAPPVAMPSEPVAAAETPVPEAPPVAEPKPDTPFDWAAALADAGGSALPSGARYVYRTRMSRLSIVSATTTTTWSRSESGYEARLEAEAVGRTILRLESRGHLGARGLEPQRYGQKSVNRPERVAAIDRGEQKVQFATRELPFTGALQDRLSFQFQLMAIAQRMPERIVPGARIAFPVAGPDDIEEYLFVVEPEREPYTFGDRTVDTVRLQRQRERGGRIARIEVWMAPELQWAPVRLRFTEADGTVWDNQLQTLEPLER
jgi:hypothetical protein